MKHNAWYYRFPGDAGAYGPMRFSVTVSENEARAHLREIYKLKRLPSGTEVWPYVPPEPYRADNVSIQFL